MSAPRNALFAAIVAQLKKIKRANGYGTDVGSVLRGLDFLPDQLTDGNFPCLQVLEALGAEAMVPMDSGQGGYFCRLQLTVAGLLKSGSDLKSDLRHQAVCVFLDDTRKALMEDVDFGGTCKESELSNPVVFVDPDRAEAFFNLTLTCTYAFGRGDL